MANRLTDSRGISTYRLIQLAMLVVLVTAFVTSFKSGSDGAGRLGFPATFVAALPLVCDVVAGVATAIHGRVRRDKEMRRLAGWFVLVPMVLSWGANSVDHSYRAAHAAAGWVPAAQAAWFAAVVLGAGICPVAVAALLHLSTRFVEFEQRQVARAKPAEPKPQSAAPKTKPTTQVIQAAPSEIAKGRADMTARVDWLKEQAPLPYGQELDAIKSQFGVSESTAKRVRIAAGRQAS